ncbi:MAG TPA: hypothetical protein VJA21_01120 [Verrucomicrobiae bacterium]
MKPEIAKLHSEAHSALTKLRGLAPKDPEALEALITVLVNNAQFLNGAIPKHPAPYRKLARKCSRWPSMITVDRDFKEGNEALIKFLELGADTGFVKPGRQWSRRTPEIRAALRVVDCLDNNHAKLPPLTRQTAGQWWQAGKPYFKALYGEAFEDHPDFARYWKNTGGDPSLNKTTRIRKVIASKMLQAFRSIAR